MLILWRTQKSICWVTDKMLAEWLRQLEEDGLISRKVCPEVPPKVEYSMTQKERKVVVVIEVLRNFGENFLQNSIFIN